MLSESEWSGRTCMCVCSTHSPASLHACCPATRIPPTNTQKNLSQVALPAQPSPATAALARAPPAAPCPTTSPPTRPSHATAAPKTCFATTMTPRSPPATRQPLASLPARCREERASRTLLIAASLAKSAACSRAVQQLGSGVGRSTASLGQRVTVLAG